MVEPRRRKQADDAPLTGVRIIIVESGYYEDIADMLLEGARRALDAAGRAHDVVPVAGGLQIPPPVAVGPAGASGGAAHHRRRPPRCGNRGRTTPYDSA